MNHGNIVISMLTKLSLTISDQVRSAQAVVHQLVILSGLIRIGLAPYAIAVSVASETTSHAAEVTLVESLSHTTRKGDPANANGVRFIHSGPIRGLQFTSDESVLVSHTETIRLWRTTDGAMLRSFAGMDPIASYVINLERGIIITLSEPISGSSEGTNSKERPAALTSYKLSSGEELVRRRITLPCGARSTVLRELSDRNTFGLFIQDALKAELIHISCVDLAEVRRDAIPHMDGELVFASSYKSSIAIVHDDRQAVAMDTVTGKQMWSNRMSPSQAIESIAFVRQDASGASGGFIAVTAYRKAIVNSDSSQLESRRSIEYWDIEHGQPVNARGGSSFSATGLTSADRVVISGSGSTILGVHNIGSIHWAIAAYSVDRRLPKHLIDGSNVTDEGVKSRIAWSGINVLEDALGICSISLSDSGRYLAIALYGDPSIHVFDLFQGDRTAAPSGYTDSFALAGNDGGCIMAMDAYKLVAKTPAESLAKTNVLSVSGSLYTSLDMASTGTFAAAARADGLLELYVDPFGRDPRRAYYRTEPIDSLRIVNNGRRAVLVDRHGASFAMTADGVKSGIPTDVPYIAREARESNRDVSSVASRIKLDREVYHPSPMAAISSDGSFYVRFVSSSNANSSPGCDERVSADHFVLNGSGWRSRVMGPDYSVPAHSGYVECTDVQSGIGKALEGLGGDQRELLRLRLSADDVRLYALCGGGFLVFNTSTGRLMQECPTGLLRAVDIADVPMCDMCVIASVNGVISLLSSSSGDIFHQVECAGARTHSVFVVERNSKVMIIVATCDSGLIEFQLDTDRRMIVVR